MAHPFCSFQEFLENLFSFDESQPLTIVDQSNFNPYLEKEEHIIFCNALLASPSSSSLKQLCVKDNLLYDNRNVDGEIAAYYAHLLTATPSLEYLSFSYTNLGGEGFRLILHSASSSSNISHLSFDIDETIGKEGMLHLARILPSMSNLRSLTLSQVEMYANGAALLSEALLTNTSLLYLDISWNRLEDLAAKHIAKMLQSNTTLQTLDLSGNKLGDLGVEHIARMLQSNNSLKTLDISNNGLGALDVVDHIAQMLQSNNTLKTLHIPRALISLSAAQHLGIALRRNKALLTLDISGCQDLGEEKMELMFLNSNITTLIYKYSPRIFKAYANILLSNSTLTTLNLSFNGETEPSRIEELFKAIAKNRCLHSLSLSGCKAVRGHKVLSCILDALRANSWLTHLNLEHTPLHVNGQTAVIEAQVKRIKEENLLGLPQMQKAEPKSIRVFFCGFPGAGKTSLKDSMISARKNILQSTWHSFSHNRLLSRNEHTRGIDIGCLPYSGISFSFWDLAGQEDYYSFHDFMFPNISHVGSPSLFFIVCNPMGENGGKKTSKCIESEIKYWLKFISSKAMPSEMFKPSVAIVFTHKDKRPYGLDISSSLEFVCDISAKFKACLDLRHRAFDVNAKSSRSSYSIFKYMHWTASNILKKCPRTYSCCNEAIRLLNVWKGEHLSSPIMHTSDFINLCNNILELKEKRAPYSVSSSNLSNEQMLVTHILNTIGDILYFPDLEYIVVDLQWFCRLIIGQMINCEGMDEQSNVDQQGLITWVKFKEIVAKSFSNESDENDVEAYARMIMKILHKLNLCIMWGISEASAPDIFIHANLKPTDDRSWKLDICSDVIKLGRRLQCLDQDHTIFTPNFFPQIQVSLFNSFAKDNNTKCEIMKDFISIINEDAMEVHLEFHGSSIHAMLNSCSEDEESECPPSYIDVLVQSPLDNSKTLKRLQYTVIKIIRDFCASWRGCQGVTLIEGILRPDCVEQPDKCPDKECVLTSTLQEQLLNIPISSMHENMYIWKKPNSLGRIPAHKTKELMGEEAFMDVMKKKMEAVQAVAAELEAETEINKEQQALSSAETSRGPLDRPLATNESDVLSSEETLHPAGQQFAIEETGISFEPLKEFISTNLGRLEEKVDLVQQKVEELGKKLDKMICIEEKIVDNLRTQIRELLNEHRSALEPKIPHLFYFTHKTDGMRQKVAKLVPKLDCYRLRFYCEGLPPLSSSAAASSSSSAISTATGRRKHHKVEDGDHEGLLLYCSKSKRLQKAIPYLNKVLKLVTMVAKVGAHVVAGAGDLVPDLSKLPALVFDSAVINVISLKLEELDPQVLQQDAALQNQSAEQWLVDILHENDCFSGKAIADSFGLYRVGHKNSSKVSWVCKAHKDHSDFFPLPLH